MSDTMVEPSPLKSLVEKAQAGDREAFQQLVTTHEARLRSTVEIQVQRSGNIAEADEVVQETLVQAFQSVRRFDWQGEESFFQWLCGIARNVILRIARSSRRDRKLLVPERLPASVASPSRVLRREERLDRLQQALSKLPPDYREVLRLSRLERLKVKEIAQRLGRSEHAVKHLMARAMKELRATFGDTESLHLPDRPLDLEASGNGKE
jgi:RNA polymerase sigma-70 factor (ECF subfamily)